MQVNTQGKQAGRTRYDATKKRDEKTWLFILGHTESCQGKWEKVASTKQRKLIKINKTAQLKVQRRRKQTTIIIKHWQEPKTLKLEIEGHKVIKTIITIRINTN